MSKPLASLSLDLDNEWSYLKTHGSPGWETWPSYLDVCVPHVLDLLDNLNLKITWFIVGLDADQEYNQEPLSMIVPRGHEVGSHSYHHEPWLHLYSPQEIRDELARAEDAIDKATGMRPFGFRGPGFSLSADVLEALHERNYLYDASTLPTWLGPVARMYYFRTAKLSKEERETRQQLFGTWKDVMRPVSAYRWRLPSGGSILELPVTTFPFVRVPFHLSYLLYLARVSETLMDAYLMSAAEACRRTGTPMSFLLHPLDVLGGDQLPDLAFFPGMDLDASYKSELFSRVVGWLSKHFDLVPMSGLARSVLGHQRLPERDAVTDFAQRAA